MKSDKEILKEAKRRFDDCMTYWSEMKQKNRDLARFISGNQWTYEARQNYENAGYAAITSNRIPTFLRQITNEVRKNTPQIQVDPRDDADEGKAEVLNDLIRNIQEESKAEIAYCKAAENAASFGIGYLKVSSKYKKLDSFEQEICIESIDDVDLVMIDPTHKSLTGCDMEYAFITVVISKDEYRRRYGKSKLAKKLNGTQDIEDLRDAGYSSAAQKWVTENEILIVEYYFKDYDTRILSKYIDNATGKEHEDFDVGPQLFTNGTFTLIEQRQVEVPVIRWTKINDLEVLEETEWPGEYIPIVCVKGDEYWLEGKRKLMGAVEPAVEAQVMLNYNKSWLAQLLQMAPKAPYIGTANQFKTYEQQWANVNVSNQAFLVYNMDGNAPPPSRDLGELPIRTASEMISTAEQDMQSIFGTFDPDNTKGQVESGKAKLIRENQSHNSNYHFYDNLSRAMEQLGCIIVQAIPVIYDSARDVQVMAQDGKKRTVSINQPDESGVIEYDLTVGDYSVSIETGPSFGTKRQETSEMIMDMVGVYPESASAVMDVAVRNMDWPGADVIADSLEALVPPAVLAARKVDKKNAAAMIPGLQSQVQALTQQVQEANVKLQEASIKVQEGADKIQIEHMKVMSAKEKSDNDMKIKMQELLAQHEKDKMDYAIKMEELRIAREELALQKAQLGLKGVVVADSMLNEHHDRHVASLDRIHVDTPEIAEADREKDTGMGDSLE